MIEMMKVLDYFKLPHPLKRGEEVVAVDEENYEQNLKECYEIARKKKGIPIFRFLIKAQGGPQEKDIEDVKKFEDKFREKRKEFLNRQKLGVWISLAVSLILGYAFYLSFNGLHFGFLTFPVRWIYETFFNSQPDKWVVWTVIALFPLGAIFRIFLPLRIPKIGKFGDFGTLYRLKRYGEILKVFDFFGKNRQRIIRLRISTYVSELKKNIGSRPDLIEKIENILKSVLKAGENDSLVSWNRSFDELLEELTLLSGEGKFPWPEIKKLSIFKQELLSWGLTNLEVGKLKIVSPESSLTSAELFSGDSPGKIALDLAMVEGFALKKANNLKSFLKETENLREEIYRDWERFEKLEDGEEKVRILRKLVSNLEILTVICTSYHFGENPNVPQEKRKGALVSFYNAFYQKLGVGLIPLKKKSAVARVSLEERKTARIKKFLLWLSANPLRGLMLTLAIVFLVSSSFSFYTLNSNQVGCERKMVFGVTDPNTLEHQMLGGKLVFKECGDGIMRIFGHDIFWYLPEPLTKPRVVDFTKEQKCDVYHIVIARNVSTGFMDWIKRFGQGNFGNTAYEGIKFTLIFSPKTKDWVGYDFDGMGSMRLSRDLGNLFRSWQSLEMEALYPQGQEEINYVYDVYLVELAKKGELAKYIESIFQEGSAVQTFSYGTNMDQVRAIYNFFVGQIDNDIKEIKGSDLAEAQKAEKIKGLELAKESLKKILDDYEQEFAKEKASIVNNPELLKKLLEGIKGREDLSLLLKEFPSLETLIINYVYYSYANEKFLASVSGELGKEAQQKMIDGLKEYLATQKISEIVEIKDASVKKFLMTMYDYQMKISQPMELLNQ